MKICFNNQKVPYQTPKLEAIGEFVAIIGGSPIRIPIQLEIPSERDEK